MLFSKFGKGFLLKTAIVSLSGFSLVGLFNAGVSQAAIENGGFETGDFMGWQTLGQVFTELAGDTISPPDLNTNYLARLSTFCPALVNNICKEDGNFMELAEFLNLEDISALEDLVDQEEVFEGSVMKTAFTANAGDVLTFQWNFRTSVTENSWAQMYNDFAFFTLSSTVHKLADTFSPFLEPLTAFENETGFRTYRYTFQTAGTYTLSFGVADVGDGFDDSELLVDNIAMESSSPSASIPESASGLALLSFGALGVVYRLRRQG